METGVASGGQRADAMGVVSVAVAPDEEAGEVLKTTPRPRNQLAPHDSCLGRPAAHADVRDSVRGEPRNEVPSLCCFVHS